VKKSVLRYLAAVPLIVATLLPSFAWTAVGAEAAVTVADFGVSNTDRNTTVEGSELLELLLGADVGSAEADYIDQSGLYKFIYSAAVPSSAVSARLTPDGLLVTVSNWTYTAQNGESVTWKPYSVTANGITESIDGEGEYLFHGDWLSVEQFDISAEYEAEFPIDSSLYNSLVNYAYTDASKKDAELSEYDERVAEHELAVTVYNQYEKDLEDYKLKLEDYNTYLEELAEYEKKQEKYEYYQSRLKEYEAAMIAYETYLADLEKYKADKALYDAYITAFDDYSRKNLEYKNYVSLVDKKVQRLSAMEAIYTQNSIGQNLYGTILGDTVDTVVRRKDEIVLGGVKPEAIDRAGECTEALRVMLEEYRGLKTDRERYLYYEEHYDELCLNFNDLHKALYAFYNTQSVIAALEFGGKLVRYRQFLAQLYVITTYLDDSIKRDENWRLAVEGGAYAYVGDLLEDVHIIRDVGTVSPKNDPGWPDEVAEPTEPEKVEQPVKPAEVLPPGRAPNEVIKPTAPETVAEPVRPTEVPKPADAPQPVSITAAERAIVEALRAGQIGKRAEVTADVTVKRTATVSKRINDLEKHHVRFISGNDVIFEYDVADGGELILPTEIPTKAATAEFEYTFSSWKDEEGIDVTDSKVYSDIEFYASFTAQTRSYPITWSVNGKTYTYEVEYGNIPSFYGNTDKPADARRIYTFVGWDNAPSRVIGPATYTAEYDSIDRLYDVSWNIDGKTVTEQYKYGERPSYKGKTEKAADNTYVYTFEGFSPSVVYVTEDVSYNASYSKKALVLDSEGNAVPVKTEGATYTAVLGTKNADITVLYGEALKREYGIALELEGCTLSLSSLAVARLSEQRVTKVAASANENEAKLLLCDASGNVIMGGEKAVLEYDTLDDTGAHLFGRVDGTEDPIYVEDGKIALNISSGQTIQTVKKYTVDVVPSDFGSYTASKEMAEAGEKIQLTQTLLRKEYVVKEIKITANASGERVELDAVTKTFVMPVGGATVEVLYERQTYKVTFLVEGNVISEKLYYLGDTVEFPPEPTKDGVGKYTYTFSGWSPEVVMVNGDAVYTAIFTETKLADEVEMSEESFKSREYEWLILFGAVGAANIGGGVALICIIRSKRKRKIL